MNLRDILESSAPDIKLQELLERLHRNGPDSSEILEELTYFKLFHTDLFSEFEEDVLSALGLFYKVGESRNIYSFLMSGIGVQHNKEYGSYLTPVQASIRRRLECSQFISISAPTSAGKSYSIRDFIASQDGDAVVIVPSRALIAEYISSFKRKFEHDKSVMITSFVDQVFLNRDPRRIFVLTPERARDLFAVSRKLDVQIFFFDEAQVADDRSRGVIFDVVIRRIRRNFPDAKLVFAHPFVDNPEAQFNKHNIIGEESFSMAYSQGAVGKSYIYKDGDKDYYFCPFEDKGHHKVKSIEFSGGFKEFAFSSGHSIMVYVSKNSIYNGSFLDPFTPYIDKFPYIEVPAALFIVESIEHLVGADSEEHKSTMVSLLKKGVVIHHGSVPLEVRFLIEDFIRGGYARICFATSTLAQGVNMPFDIVWLENMRFMGATDEDKSLEFKNLIGRSGRLTNKQQFDFGYVYTKSPVLFSKRICGEYRLDDESLLDKPAEDDQASDERELIDSINDGSFDEDKNLPKSKVDRLSSKDVMAAVEFILNVIYSSPRIKENIGGDANRAQRLKLTNAFLTIYQSSLGRFLLKGEIAVFNSAMEVFYHVIQGRTFREIVGIKYSRASKRDQGKVGYAGYLQPASALPNINLENAYPMFDSDILARDVSYDRIVFDTYDYLDTVISFSLKDVFIAALKIYKNKSSDDRVDRFIELLQFGTNNVIHVMLIRYGLPPEDAADIAPYIQSIDDNEIIFNNKIHAAPEYVQDMVRWYLP